MCKNEKSRVYDSYVSTYISFLKGQGDYSSYEWMYRTFKKMFGHFLPKNRDAKILDVACGGGEFLYFLQKEGYRNSFGVDISEEQIKRARHAGVQNIVIDNAMKFLRKRLDEYDFISAHDIIEHFAKDKVLEFLDLVYKSLGNGGTVLISTPNAQSLFSARHRYSDFTHEVGFAPTSLAQILRVSGFRDVQIYPKEPVVLDLRSGVRFVLWKVLKQVLKLCLVVEEGMGRSEGEKYLNVLTPTMFAVARRLNK